jgi:hypothetical protein
MKTFKWSGIAIAAGGVLLIFVNAVLTPMLDLDIPFTEMMASDAYVLRLSVASLTVFLLLAGSPGLHVYQAGQTGLFGKAAFGLAFLGCAFLFAHEWGQVFFVHSMAVAAPDGLQAMEDTAGLNLYDLEAIIAILFFTLGWIAFAASMLIARVFSRLGPMLVIAGFFAVPLLTAATSLILGGALGNAVLGTGFVLLGRELIKNPARNS